jgi:hypothetical protein
VNRLEPLQDLNLSTRQKSKDFPGRLCLLPIQIKPPFRFPHKSADLVHAVGTSIELEAGNELDRGMVFILLTCSPFSVPA